MTAAPTKAPGDPFIADPDHVADIARRAFGRAKDAALAENKRLGVRSYGTVGEARATVRRRAKAKTADHAVK
ncbi:MAG: hypothetical protein JOY70_10555 [Acidisphaera sp.]|nr:hypothetical protein [Acidisphaera sp.]